MKHIDNSCNLNFDEVLSFVNDYQKYEIKMMDNAFNQLYEQESKDIKIMALGRKSQNN